MSIGAYNDIDFLKIFFNYLEALSDGVKWFCSAGNKCTLCFGEVPDLFKWPPRIFLIMTNVERHFVCTRFKVSAHGRFIKVTKATVVIII